MNRKSTVFLFSVLLFFHSFGQVPNNSIKVPSSPTIPGLMKNAGNPALPPTRTCGTMEADSALRANNPGLGTLQDFENWLQKKIAQDSQNGMKIPPVYTLPVIVHIIYNGEAVGSGSNISQAQVNSQFDVFNEDFRRLNADYNNTPAVFKPSSSDPEIQFCKAVVSPTGTTLAEPGIDRVNRSSKGFSAPPYTQSYIDGTIKPATSWDPTKYFNVWVLNLGNSLLGYAQFPSNSGLSGLNANGGASNTDGIVILYTAFGRTGNVSAPYNKGRTATHEAGHWLGLRHIWGDGNCANDFCNDTPTQQTSNYGCPSFPHVTCSNGPNGDMFMNYMDYTDDQCMFLFSGDQRTRMRTVLQNSPRRVELVTSTVCNSNSPPVCGFSASSFTVTAGGFVNFTDQSGGSPTSWVWTFQGGTPSSSTSQNPSGIAYSTAGTYNATLIATNSYGTCTLTQVVSVVANVGCDTLNFPPPGTLVTYTGGGGYICGWNTTYKDISKAEYFASYSPYTHVTGGLVYFRSTYRSNGSNATVSFRIWNNTGTGGSPGTILGSKTITLQSLDAVIPAGGGLYQIIFDSPVQVTTPYYFGLTMIGFTNSDSLGIISNTNGDSSPNTAWEQWSDNSWHAFNEGSSWGVSISQFISPYMTNLPPNTVISANDTSACIGSSITFNGAASVNESSYSWSFPGGTPSTSSTASQSVTYSTAGTYTAILTVGGSCQGKDQDSLTNITISAGPSITTSSVNVSCFGGNNGTATATPGGGTTPYSYSWSNGQNTGTATGLSSGTYTVTVTDNNGCYSSSSVAVTQPGQLTVSASSTNASCGGTNGTATAVPSGGTSPYNFLWNNGQTTATATGLTAGTYSVTITDNAGCTKTTSTTVSSSGGGLSATTAVTNVSCNGANTGSATATPTGGTSPYTYSWNTTPGQSGQTATGLPAGTFSVSISDANSCSVVQSITITQPSALTTSSSQTNGTCGNANGTATVTAGGGTTGYTYLWSNGQVNSTATGLSSGNYGVTVTDANNCTVSSTFTISNSPAPTITTTASNVTCNGNNNGSATAAPSGGSGPFTFAWSNSATSSTISGLSPGTYSVTVTDNNSCSSTASVSITQPGVLNSSAAATNASCNGVCDGALSALASGGISPYSFSWSGGLGTGAGKSNVCAGNYFVTVSDSNSCTSVASISVNQPAAIVLNTSSTLAVCGSANGTATVNASGGAGGFSFLWNNSQTGQTATGLIAGTYSVTVTDSSFCTKTTTVSVSNDIPTTLSISSSNVSCNGGNNGSATAIPGGGTLPYSYSWSNGGTGATISALSAGTYAVTVTDANSCAVIQSVVINEPAILAVNPTATGITCFGNNNGVASANSSGGTSPYSYLWNTGGTQSSINNLSPGTYSVTVTDANSCSSQGSVAITEPSALSVSVNSSPSSCNGVCDGTLNATPTGGTSPFSFNWSGGLGNGASKTNVCAGTYSVTISDANGCTSTSSATVSQPSAINLSTSSSNATCGISNGSASVIASGGAGGFSYLWSNGATNTSISGLPAGTYSVTVTDANNCSGNASMTVANPGAPTVSTGAANPTCNGSCNGTASAIVSGGNSPYSYSWNNGQTGQNATSLCAGTFSVTVTDANSCISSSSVTLTQPSAIVLNISENSNPCSVTATASASGGAGGFSYLWSNGQTSQTATGLFAGTFSVTVTDANNCTKTSSINITGNPANISASVNGTNILCNGDNNGSLNASATGGTSPYTYSWSNGQTGTVATGLAAGTYFFTVTDLNGCSTTGSGSITQPAVLASSVSSTNISCNNGSDGSAIASASGGVSPYSCLWSNGAATFQISNLSAQTYTVTITDNNSCTSVDSVTVSEPSAIVLTSSSTPETCGMNNGTGTVNISGGTAPYSFQWDANAGSQVSQTATGLNGGISVSYTVLVLDASGCLKNISVPVPGSTALSGSVSTTDANCNANDGTATVNVSGGTPPYSYLWSNGATTFQIANLSGQSYSITVTDNEGCTFLSSAVVNSMPGISITAASSPSQCGGNNGFATVSVGGGVSPYSYSWSNGDSLPTSDSLFAGNYSVIVWDVNGCSDTAFVVVGGVSTMSVSPIISNENCGKSDGVVIANVSGGNPPFTFIWSDSTAQTSQVVVGLSEGTYSVTITDADNCTAVSTVNIVNTSNLTIYALQPAGGHCGSTNGTVASSASGGPLPYTYLWSNGDTTSTANGMGSGTYSVTITDSAGCKVTGSVFVGSTPLVVSDSVTGETCHGKKDGSIDISVSGGVSPYSFKWSDEATSEDLNNISAGEYSLTVTDANGCPLKDSITVGILEEDGCLDIPSGFTPNGDGKNDTWKIRGIGNFPDISVEIYNRWGSVVFSSKGYSQAWDGTNNGSELPSAAYYYLITLGDGTTKTGSVTIVR